MYLQLWRAFRPARNLGEWWRATKGIVHDCPLNVTLMHIVTCIWKMEMDAMRKHVVLTNRWLSPHNIRPPLPQMLSAHEP